MATLAELTTKLTEAKSARDAALLAQSYGQGDRSLQRAHLAAINSLICQYQSDIDALTAKAAGARNPLFVTAGWNSNYGLYDED